MKAAIALAALAQLTLAQPHRAQPAHGHAAAHQHMAEKRADVEIIFTEVSYATVIAPANAVVYVDANGTPVTTSYINVDQEPTSTPTAQRVEPEYVPPPAPTTLVKAPAVNPAPAPKPATSAAPAPAPAPKPSPSSAPAPAPPSSGSNGLGITYSPYHASGNCKTQSEVDADFSKLKDYKIIRIYGVDCNQLQTVGKNVRANGQKLLAGIFDISQTASAAQAIVDTFKDNWSIIDTVSVGNELVNSGAASVDQVIAAIGTARGVLKAGGFNGNVVTVDTFTAVIANPALCHASDYAAVNAHAFFDSSILAAGAGVWAWATKLAVSAACGGKRTVLTESGWPSAGGSNGLAAPTPANQAAAIASIRSKFTDDVFLFTAYNDYWKKDNQWTFGAEHFWGIYGDSPSSF